MAGSYSNNNNSLLTLRVLFDAIKEHRGPFLDTPQGTADYEEVKSYAARVDSFLRERNITRGDTVAVSMSNTQLAAKIWFSLLREGVSIVPLNPALLDEEIVYILRMAEVKLLISDKNLSSKAKTWCSETSKIPIVIAEDESWNNYSEAEELYVDPADIAVIFFTSGTTGRPKGAMLTHKALIANATSCAKSYRLNSKSAFACPIPIFHSLAATVCLFLPSIIGGRTYLHSPLELKNFVEIVKLLPGKRILVGVPSILEGLVQVSGGKISNIDFTVSGGAALGQNLRERFFNTSQAPLFEGYGTTECGPVISSQLPEAINTTGSVGTPVDEVEVEIRSSDGNKLRAEEVGEIVVRTPALMAGYYDLASATRASIKGGWFYTNDLGYLNKNGELFIVDRLADAITVKGITVLPQNIESILNEHPSVMESAVVGIPDGVGGEVPWAFVRPNPKENAVPSELISFCKKRLPVYAVPKGIELRDFLPKTITGKVLKRTLRQKWL